MILLLVACQAPDETWSSTYAGSLHVGDTSFTDTSETAETVETGETGEDTGDSEAHLDLDRKRAAQAALERAQLPEDILEKLNG